MSSAGIPRFARNDGFGGLTVNYLIRDDRDPTRNFRLEPPAGGVCDPLARAFAG